MTLLVRGYAPALFVLPAALTAGIGALLLFSACSNDNEIPEPTPRQDTPPDASGTTATSTAETERRAKEHLPTYSSTKVSSPESTGDKADMNGSSDPGRLTSPETAENGADGDSLEDGDDTSKPSDEEGSDPVSPGPSADASEDGDPQKKQAKRALTRSLHESVTGRSGTISTDPFQPEGPPLDVSGSPVRVYRRSSTVIVPGEVTNRTSILELFLCSAGGKTHETVLSTEISPKKFNLSLVLTNFTPEKNPSETGPQYLGDPTVPEGDPVVVLVEWQLNDGSWVRYRAEDLVWNQAEEIVMRQFGFVFAGSQFIRNAGPNREKKEIFEASRVKTLIALLHDPSAVLDIPVPQGGTDTAFEPRKEVLPPVSTEVNIILRPPTDDERAEIDREINASFDAWGPKKEDLKGNEGRDGAKKGKGPKRPK